MRFLVTAGPTYEQIDAVRFIGNRSSGRMGIALYEAAVASGHEVTLCLGPVPTPPPPSPTVLRFRSTEDLRTLLLEHAPRADVLVMAAAVADFRPKHPMANKLRRAEALALDLVPTPDLLAEVASRRRDGQLLVGFALEERSALHQRALEKLRSKNVDAIVANPLETMDASDVEGELFLADGRTLRPAPDGVISKTVFARWLAITLADEWTRRRTLARTPS